MPAFSKPGLREVAGRLLAHEVTLARTVGNAESPVFPVCDRLRGPLGRLLGVGGFRALHIRSLALACAEVPWLRPLKIASDGSVEGLNEARAAQDIETVALGEVVLIAHLLGLLLTFIGASLTLRLLHDTWQELAPIRIEEEKIL